jgi:DNA-binding MarR family transcriptional regulator
MTTLTTALKTVLNLNKVNTILSRRFDNSLGGVSFNEFIILYHISQSPDGKMRRIDLAEKIGLTASGVTRLLLPMEKTGLIKRGEAEHDARVSYVLIATGGQRRLTEALERAEELTEELLPPEITFNSLTTLLIKLGGSIK